MNTSSESGSELGSDGVGFGTSFAGSSDSAPQGDSNRRHKRFTVNHKADKARPQSKAPKTTTSTGSSGGDDGSMTSSQTGGQSGYESSGGREKLLKKIKRISKYSSNNPNSTSNDDSQKKRSSSEESSQADTDNNNTYSESNTSSRPSKRPSKKPKVDVKRIERNAREQERSNKIATQFSDLQTILSEAGMILPKNTKGCILSVTLEYLKMLFEHDAQKQQENAQLEEQIRGIANGSLGDEPALLIRKVADKNGCLAMISSTRTGSNGSSSPSSSDLGYVSSLSKGSGSSDSRSNNNSPMMDDGFVSDLGIHHYTQIFQTVPVGMAVATLGGTFLDSNSTFCQLTNLNKEEVRGMSIFHLTLREDLQYGFDRLKDMMTGGSKKPIYLRGSVENKQNQDTIPPCLCISLIQNAGDAKNQFLCVTLLQSTAKSHSDRSACPRIVPARLNPLSGTWATEQGDSKEETEARKQDTNGPPLFIFG